MEYIEKEVMYVASHIRTFYPSKDFVPDDSCDVFMIAVYQTDGGDEIKCIGTNLPVLKPVKYQLYGTWHKDKNDRVSFSVSSFTIVLPEDKDGFIRTAEVLSPGIKKKALEKAYDKFQEKIWDIVCDDPNQLQRFGVSTRNIKKLSRKIKRFQSDFLLTRFFSSYGVECSSGKRRKIIERLGPDAAKNLAANPYLLCGNGFTLKTCDRIGQQMKISEGDIRRLTGAIARSLKRGEVEGNSCIPSDTLLKYLKNISGQSEEICRKALKEKWKKSYISIKGNCYSFKSYEEETSIVKNVQRLMARKNMIPDDRIEKGIQNAEKHLGFRLAQVQKDAVSSVFKSPVSIITGGPGTGKTTIIKAIIAVAGELSNASKPVLMAPTGKAARRMTEASGYPAQTVHSCIGYNGPNAVITEDALEGNLFIVDEASMLDQHVASMLFKKIPERSRFVLVGDPDQLPSVGYGNILSDLIESDAIPVKRLDVVFRQNENELLNSLTAIHDGAVPLESNAHFHLYSAISEQDVFEGAVNKYLELARKEGVENVILICPFRNKKKGSVNVFDFNREIQKRFNPGSSDELKIRCEKTQTTFSLLDPVMQMTNTKDVKNGDIGVITSITRDKGEAAYATIDFGYDHTVRYSQQEMQQVNLAYATTVHKAQGSEAKNVIFANAWEHKPMNRKNLVYTAATRSKGDLYVYTQGDEKKNAFYDAIENNGETARCTSLASRLKKRKK